MDNHQVTNILIVGVGGQGTLLSSRILARMAQDMGYDVKVSEVHGMAQRGGSVVSQVRYGPKVYAPIVKKGAADIILAFEKLESARWVDYLKPDGLVIINDEKVNPAPVMSGKIKYPEDIDQKVAEKIQRTIVVQATRIARDCGNSRAANVVLVGLLSAAMDLPADTVKAAIRQTVPTSTLEVNLRAFTAGREQYQG